MTPLAWTWAIYDFWNMRIPHICLWSPSILPRPLDWDSNTAIAGYTFNLEHQAHFQPTKSLESFLETDQPVLAVSFGSASVPDAVQLMTALFSAVHTIGAKAVVCWSRSDIGNLSIPDDIHLVDQVPHGWLLPRVQGFVHHGGAGHTAIGLKFGIPMLIIPFFLDQNFWAAKVQEFQLGPPPLHRRSLTAHRMVSSLKDLLSLKYQPRCREMASQINSQRDGAEVAVETVARLQRAQAETAACEIISDLRASWKHVHTGIRLSGAAAACLASRRILRWSDLILEPGTDWAKRRSNASTEWVKVLTNLTDLIYRLITLIYTVLAKIVAPWAKSEREDYSALEQEDPVRQARINQGVYDLQYIIEQSPEREDGTSIEECIIFNWRSLSTARFHAKFTDGLGNGHI
ncbi:MAG: hypothetical protein Q9208_006662 [Pyrenodesmia sp. 3 TL-2023]